MKLIKKLQLQSNGVMDVFRKALSDYYVINDKIAMEHQARKVEMNKLNDEIVELETLRAVNEQSINKLNNILN